MSAPVEKELSDKVTMRWGYPDGRVEIDLRLSKWLPAVTHILDAADVGVAWEAFRLANAWAEAVKARKGGDGGDAG